MYLRAWFRMLNPKERLITIASGFGIVAGIAIIVTFAYLNATFLEPAKGGTYREGTIGSPKLINPLYATSNDVDKDLVSLIYSGLMKRSGDLSLVPDLASGYTISDDQKVYTFTLRDNAKWHNGNPVTADDILFTFSAIQNREYKSPLASQFTGVVVDAPDEKTITFTLKEPFAPFLESLTVGILPSNEWSSIPPENAPLAKLNLKPIGSGPFEIEENSAFIQNSEGSIISYKLVRNNDFYGTAPYLDSIVFKYFPDSTTASEALRSNQVDGLSFVSAGQLSTYPAAERSRFLTLSLPQYTALFFNQSRNEAIKQQQVREALVYALDRNKLLNESYAGQGQVIDSPILPGYLGYNPDVKKHEYNPEKANELLTAAGWTLDPETRTRKNKQGTVLALTLTTTNQMDATSSAELIKQMWEAVGVQTTLVSEPTSRISTSVIQTRDYDILLYGHIVGNDPDPYPFWHSSQTKYPGVNLAITTNRQVDQLLSDARKSTDSEQRRLKYLEFQNILATEVPAIFLYNPTYIYPLGRSVKGFGSTRVSEPSDRFSTVTSWYIRQHRTWK